MTKKKTLLKEGTVRQFMKLANLQPLASGFVDKLYEQAEADDDDNDDNKEETNENKEVVDAFPRDDGSGIYTEQEEEDPGEELDMGAEEGPEGEEEEFEVEEEGGDVDVNALVRAIAAAIETETGVSVDVAEEGGEEEEEVDLGDEEEEGGEELDFEEEGEEELGGEEEGLEEIISTIAENVTNRLKKMTEAKKKVKK